MLTLHIEAETFSDLVARTMAAIGATISSGVQHTKNPAASLPAGESPPVAAETAPAAPASVVEPPAVSPAKRGRPRKTVVAPAGAPSPSGDPVPAPQAEVGNTASAPAGFDASPAEDAGAAETPDILRASAAALTGLEVKNVLRAMSTRFKDWNAGADKAMALVKVYGIDRLKDLDTLDQTSLRAIVAAAEAEKGDA